MKAPGDRVVGREVELVAVSCPLDYTPPSALFGDVMGGACEVGENA